MVKLYGFCLSIAYIALKFFRRWEAGVWDMEALGSESGGKLAVYRRLKDFPAAELISP